MKKAVLLATIICWSYLGNVQSVPFHRTVVPIVPQCKPPLLVGLADQNIRPPWSMSPYFVVVDSWITPFLQTHPTSGAFVSISLDGLTYETTAQITSSVPGCEDITNFRSLLAVPDNAVSSWSLTSKVDQRTVRMRPFTYDGESVR